MNNETLVTSSQANVVRIMANSKGVTNVQFEAALDDGKFDRFLETLKVDSTVLTPPQGGRLHTVRICFKPDRKWIEAIDAAGPNTPKEYNIWRVGEQYPISGTKEIEEDLILLNFPQKGFCSACVWAESNRLEVTVPREVFAIGEQHPNLHNEIKQDPICVVATRKCIFEGNDNACYVWWRGSERRANLLWTGNFESTGSWFAFRKPALKT